jgi:hypothetical protein
MEPFTKHDEDTPIHPRRLEEEYGNLGGGEHNEACRLRGDLPSRSLAPAMGTKGGGMATAILNLNHLT